MLNTQLLSNFHRYFCWNCPPQYLPLRFHRGISCAARLLLPHNVADGFFFFISLSHVVEYLPLLRDSRHHCWSKGKIWCSPADEFVHWLWIGNWPYRWVVFLSLIGLSVLVSRRWLLPIYASLVILPLSSTSSYSPVPHTASRVFRSFGCRDISSHCLSLLALVVFLSRFFVFLYINSIIILH